MDVLILGIAALVLVVAVIIFVKRPISADGISAEEFSRLKQENGVCWPRWPEPPNGPKIVWQNACV